MRLGSIFDDLQPVSGCEFSYLPQIHCPTVEVDGNDRPGLRRKHSLGRGNIEVKGARIDITENRLGAHVADCLRGREERVCGYQNLIPWLDPSRLQSEFECGCA